MKFPENISGSRSGNRLLISTKFICCQQIDSNNSPKTHRSTKWQPETPGYGGMGMFPSKDFANFPYRLGEDQRLVHLHGWWRAGPKNFAVPGIRLSEQRPTLILSSLITSSSAFWRQSLVLGLMALQTVLKHSKGLIFFPLSPLSPRS